MCGQGRPRRTSTACGCWPGGSVMGTCSGVLAAGVHGGHLAGAACRRADRAERWGGRRLLAGGPAGGGGAGAALPAGQAELPDPRERRAASAHPPGAAVRRGPGARAAAPVPGGGATRPARGAVPPGRARPPLADLKGAGAGARNATGTEPGHAGREDGGGRRAHGRGSGAVTAGGRPERAWRWAAGLAWGLWGLAMAGLGVIWWLDRLMREAGRADLAPLGVEVAAPVLAAVSATTVGAVLASRRPRHPVGWLLLAAGLCLNASGVASAYADYGLLARPGALPGAREVSLYLPAIF